MCPSVGRFRENFEQDEIIAAVDLLLQVFATYDLHEALLLRCVVSLPGAARGVGSFASSSPGSRRRSDTSRPSSARGGLAFPGKLPPPLPAPRDLRPLRSRPGWPSGSGTMQGVSAPRLSRRLSLNLRRP